MVRPAELNYNLKVYPPAGKFLNHAGELRDSYIPPAAATYQKRRTNFPAGHYSRRSATPLPSCFPPGRSTFQTSKTSVFKLEGGEKEEEDGGGTEGGRGRNSPNSPAARVTRGSTITSSLIPTQSRTKVSYFPEFGDSFQSNKSNQLSLKHRPI